MNQKQLDTLSSSLSKAINPAARKIEATARILEQIEPLPLISQPDPRISSTQDPPDSTGPGRRPSPRPERIHPVENSTVNLATLAKKDAPGWSICPEASLGKMTTVANLTTSDNSTHFESPANLTSVKGTLHVPNTIMDVLLPTLEPAAALLYLRLFRLSHGYRNERCIASLQKLATSTNTSQKTVQRAIDYLEKRQLIIREITNLGGKMRGIQFRVRIPGSPVNLTTLDKMATPAKMTGQHRVAKMTTLVNLTTNKDDDLLNTNHHQSENDSSFPQPTAAEPQHARFARRDTESTPHSGKAPLVHTGPAKGPALNHLAQTITAYTTATQNAWLPSDTVAYLQNRIDQVSVEKITNVIQAVFARADSRVNSFAYFVKEIVATKELRTLAHRRKALAAIVKRVRENHQGREGYSLADLAFDTKAACAREGVIFDHDLFNEAIQDRV